ncbi:hypothetical protein [Nonomuraea africana]|uniref:WD40 repeat domain-containing protein n=1 Tax=Nonomuraea africana TaxID=46171 RepID=A0ABR9KAD6_9ACTN|nr:hypothetical protein [Nonomuraea africana]MBE1558865.1 hypothetical protein [Nonomuraea africana]
MKYRLLGAAAVVLAVGGTIVPAHADTTATNVTKSTVNKSTIEGSGAVTARVAWVGSCEDADGISVPCGKWRVRLRAGGTVTVADAAATAVDARGRKADSVGKFAISGDGQWILYERAKDHRLVVRKVAGGRGTVLPASLSRKGTEPMRVWLSPAGDRVLVEYDEGREPGKIVTVATGKIVKLPAADDLEGLSGDGDEALAMRYNNDNTTTLVAHGMDGHSVAKVPPQVVVNAATRALSADGHTVAVLISGNTETRQPPKLRLYDLATDRLSASMTLPLKPDASVYLAHWSGDGRLTVKAQTGGDEKPTVVRVLTVDTTTGAAKPVDTFTVTARNYTWLTAGE